MYHDSFSRHSFRGPFLSPIIHDLITTISSYVALFLAHVTMARLYLPSDVYGPQHPNRKRYYLAMSLECRYLRQDPFFFFFCIHDITTQSSIPPILWTKSLSVVIVTDSIIVGHLSISLTTAHPLTSLHCGNQNVSGHGQITLVGKIHPQLITRSSETLC